jgi:hypothetical protein
MTDGDESHSSKRRLDIFTKGESRNLFCFLLEFHFFYVYLFAFAFVQMFISLPVGPHPPNG